MSCGSRSRVSHSRAMSHVTGARVTHYRGAVSSVLINSNNSCGAYTGVVTWNMMHVS